MFLLRLFGRSLSPQSRSCVNTSFERLVYPYVCNNSKTPTRRIRRSAPKARQSKIICSVVSIPSMIGHIRFTESAKFLLVEGSRSHGPLRCQNCQIFGYSNNLSENSRTFGVGKDKGFEISRKIFELFFFFFFISPLKNSIKNNTNLQNSVPPKAGKDTESSSPHFEWHLQIFNHIVLKVQTSLAPNNAKTSSVSVLKTKKKKKKKKIFFFFFFFLSLNLPPPP